MGSIVRILALHPSGEWVVFWESLLQRGDSPIEYLFRKRQEYRVFEPLDVCETPFKTARIRLELDTRTVADWNELDYCRVVGAPSLPEGVVVPGEELVYVPYADQFGDDSFEFTMTDCAFNPKRQPAPATVSISILPENDVTNVTSLVIEGRNELTLDQFAERYVRGRTVLIDLHEQGVVTDVDHEALQYALSNCPEQASTCKIDQFGVFRLEWQGDLRPETRGFDLQFTVSDEGRAPVAGRLRYAPQCEPGTILDMELLKCKEVSGVSAQYMILAGVLGVLLALGIGFGVHTVRKQPERARQVFASLLKHEFVLGLESLWEM